MPEPIHESITFLLFLFIPITIETIDPQPPPKTPPTQLMNNLINPRLSLSIIDPEKPYKYLEIRTKIMKIADDPKAKFFLMLVNRYEAQIFQRPFRYSK